LGHGLRLDDVGAALALGLGIVVSFELIEVKRQVPGEREEIILLWSFLSHPH
jgi:hypothetical protein